jgi:hypothetical protein
MKARLALTAIAITAAAMLLPTTAGAQGRSPATTINTQLQRSIPLTGTAPVGSTFDGRYKITGFQVRNGRLLAVGTLRATLRTALGRARTVTRNVTLPAALSTRQPGAARSAAAGSCRILFLTLGPLDLDLLGLRVQLNQVILRITGVRGAGNLLGNLLCAITGLLDPNPLSARRG